MVCHISGIQKSYSMTLKYNTQMEILHLACLNNNPEIQLYLGPKCAPVGGEPHILQNKGSTHPPLDR